MSQNVFPIFRENTNQNDAVQYWKLFLIRRLLSERIPTETDTVVVSSIIAQTEWYSTTITENPLRFTNNTWICYL